MCGEPLVKGKNLFPSSKRNRVFRCKSCITKEIRASGRGLKYRRNLKTQVLAHYSVKPYPICANPFSLHKEEITDLDVLTIDHVKGNGANQRRELWKKYSFQGFEFYRWLKQHNFPEGYQVLCMNCQWKKRHINKEWRNQHSEAIEE